MLRRKQARPQGGKGQAVTSPVTTDQSIRTERLEYLADVKRGIDDPHDVGYYECCAMAAELLRVRAALTASGEALREYGHHKNSCRFVSNVPNPGIRPGSCTCGLEAAMEKANG